MFELVPFESLKDLQDLNQEKLSDYPGLQVIKQSVFSAIESELGRSLEQKERVEEIDTGVYPTRYVFLTGLPVVSVSEVLVDDEVLDPEYYRITKSGLRLSTQITEAFVQVTYTGGYENDAIPANLTRAALMQTTYEFQNKENIGASSVTTEGGTVNTPALQLLPMVIDILDEFKHPGRIS